VEATAHQVQLIILAAQSSLEVVIPSQVPLPVPGAVHFGRWRVEAEVWQVVDIPSLRSSARDDVYEVWCAAQATVALLIRTRQQGDRLRPLGLGGTRKLQDLFVDRKVPRLARDQLPVVAGPDGILWVVGVALAEHARLRDGDAAAVRLRAWRPADLPVEGAPEQ
jgi:tRNA(Ile)-lysidine synthase